MFSPAARTRLPGPETQTISLDGYCENGQWFCNCKPRKGAARYQTRKKTQNHGRWFYTCRQPDGRKCGFFLWEDEADRRSESAATAAAAARTDAPSTLATPPGSLAKNGPAAGRSFEEHLRGRRAPTLALARVKEEEDDEEDFDLPPLSLGDEDVWTDAHAGPAAAMIHTPASSPLGSPTKPSATALYQTPGPKTKRSFEPLYPTPHTAAPPGSQHQHLVARAATVPRNPPPASRKRARSSDLDATPTPKRFRDALSRPSRGDSPSGSAAAAGPAEPELTDDVLALLASQPIDADVRARLRVLLKRHVMRSRGVLRGRDITRDALDAARREVAALRERLGDLEAARREIAALRERIGDLETEREMHRMYIKKLKGDVAGAGLQVESGSPGY